MWKFDLHEHLIVIPYNVLIILVLNHLKVRYIYINVCIFHSFGTLFFDTARLHVILKWDYKLTNLLDFSKFFEFFRKWVATKPVARHFAPKHFL